MANNSSKIGLIKKALYIWIVQYHGMIPMKILKRYIHKFRHESENISKYGQRYFDPSDAQEYNRWLSLQEYKTDTVPLDVTFIGKDLSGFDSHGMPCCSMERLDLSGINSEYIGVVNGAVSLYPQMDAYLSDAVNGDITYFDHDMNLDGNRSNPVLKPDFSYFLLRQYNCFGDLYIIRKELLEQFNGEDFKPYLWLLKLSDQNVRWNHVSKILYAVKKEQLYDVDTVKMYFKDTGIKADITVNADGMSAYVSYPVIGNPLVSIIIPTKDGKNVLKTCIDSIYEKSTYRNFEIVIADNNSEKEETFQYFEQLKKEHDNISVIKVSTPFNFSLINNRAIAQSHGDYVIMLNNDTEIITPNWLEKMIGYAQMEKCGSVGVKLYYGDGTIQHGGVITGKGGGFAHRYYRKPHDEKGYLHTMETVNDVACCTAACLMIPRKKFDEVGGMNEELTVQFNDVDLGLKLYEHGYFNVFMPDVELFHYESKSRGIDKNKEAVDRFESEVSYAETHYASYLRHDPFYNDQFDKNYDYMLIVGTGSN